MKQWQVIVVVLLIAVVAGAGGYQFHQRTNQAETVQVARSVGNPYVKIKEDVTGTIATDFSLADIDGAQRTLSEWQGKVIAINFWATWCPPCRDEIPAFVELQQTYASEGLQFIGVALQTAEEIRGFVNEYQVNYPSLVGDNDAIEVSKKLGNDIGALPYTVIIDRKGIIRFTHRGPLSKSEAEDVISGLL